MMEIKNAETTEGRQSGSAWRHNKHLWLIGSLSVGRDPRQPLIGPCVESAAQEPMRGSCPTQHPPSTHPAPTQHAAFAASHSTQVQRIKENIQHWPNHGTFKLAFTEASLGNPFILQIILTRLQQQKENNKS